jgi:hypothetical protein
MHTALVSRLLRDRSLWEEAHVESEQPLFERIEAPEAVLQH